MPDYPHVKDWQRDIVARYGEHLTNTGGNDPLDLINDLQDPAQVGFGRTNMPRFVLAVAVDAQVALLSVLELRGILPPLEKDEKEEDQS
jgi:hypothetical protein